jgi:DNA-binding NarL/FixJ family response regulator
VIESKGSKMASAGYGNGSEFLARRSDATLAKASLPKLSNVLVVEDEGVDARRLTAVLRIVLGRDVMLRLAPSLDKAIDEVLKSLPDALFLDDYLKPNDSALQTIPLVRRAGYPGPIIVVSGEVDRPRRIELRKAGASDIIHKDDIDSVNVSEALIRAYAPRGQ